MDPLTKEEVDFLNYGPTPLELECRDCGSRFSRCAIAETYGCNTTDEDVLKQKCININGGEICGGTLKLIPIKKSSGFKEGMEKADFEGIKKFLGPRESAANRWRNQHGYNA